MVLVVVLVVVAELVTVIVLVVVSVLVKLCVLVSSCCCVRVVMRGFCAVYPANARLRIVMTTSAMIPNLPRELPPDLLG